MVWGIVKEAPVLITYKFASKGVEKMSSDNSQPVGRDEIEKLTDMASSNFGVYSERLIRYLYYNQNKYPSYNQYSNGDLLPKRNGFRCVTALNNPYTPEQRAKLYRNLNRNNNGYPTYYWDWECGLYPY